ncbi:MAG: AIR synthase-related protein, partial [Anaerovorax sp.]
GAVENAKMGIIPAGAYDNRTYLEPYIKLGSAVKREIADIMFDPQTSGGLLISLPEAEGEKLIHALNDEIPTARIVGQVVPDAGTPIIIES